MKMANEKKSIIEEALLEAQAIDATFKSNAKEILAQTMSSEIEAMVKESLNGSKRKRLKEDEEEENETDLDLDLDLDSEEGEEDMDLDLDAEGEEGDEDMDLDLDLDSDDEGEEDLDLDLDLDADGEEGEEDLDLDGLNLGGDTDLEIGGGLEDDEDMEVIDLTGSNDSDAISVFKKMGPEDEIEVVNDNGIVTLKDNKSGSEYRIELNANGEAVSADVSTDDDEVIELGEGVIYEIIVDDEEDYMDDEENLDPNDEDYGDNLVAKMDKYNDYHDADGNHRGNQPITANTPKMAPPTSYMSRTSNKQGPGGKPFHRTQGTGIKRTPYTESTTPQISKLIRENTNLNTKNSELANENSELKENYNTMVGALKQFRTKLQEVALFNSNLTYAVRLFTEQTTTKDEKNEILKRLDESKSVKESETIYRQLVKEFIGTKKAPIKEAIEEKINKTASSGSLINEQSVFVHPELENMKKLWSYNYKK